MQKKFLQTLAVVCITFGGTNPALCNFEYETLTCSNLCNPGLDINDRSEYLGNICQRLMADASAKELKDTSELKDVINGWRTKDSCIQICDRLLRNDHASVCNRR